MTPAYSCGGNRHDRSTNSAEGNTPPVAQLDRHGVGAYSSIGEEGRRNRDSELNA